ncbi:type II toxin-antitoxin system VapC family toxin [Candidatus Peregrinibacteria bacterium]|nr:type II toxin-antitoxin system VapC family toxin [Candidatus Peregrinibacteria bacterium]
MKTTIVVDSSVFISSFVTQDSRHKISTEFFATIKKKQQQIIAPINVVFEILHAYYRLTKNRQKTDNLYQMIIDWNLTKELRIANIESSFLVYFTAYHHLFNLKTADSIVALTAHRFKYPLVSWDKQFLKNTKKHIKTFSPDEFLRSL